MNAGPVALVAASSIFFSVCAFSPGELRNYFEWGEYQQLIDSLEPHIIVTPCSDDSTRCARYHCYLAVAYFGKGRIGDARKQFLSALGFDPAVRPDRDYISDEINDFFNMALSDFSEARKRTRVKDSLLVAKQQAFDANLQAVRQRELRKGRRAGSLLAISFFTLGAAFAAAAAYEYFSTKEPYAEFQTAASQGDKLTYDRLRPSIRRANGIIVGCAVAAAISETAGITFTIRSIRMR